MSDLSTFAYRLGNKKSGSKKGKDYDDNDWILQLLCSAESQSAAIATYAHAMHDSMLALGDPTYIASLLGKKENETVLTRTLAQEINSIIGSVSMEPRSCEIVVNEDKISSGGAIDQDMKDQLMGYQEKSNKFLANMGIQPFAIAMQCLKERLLFGSSWVLFSRDYDNNVSSRLISPLQIFEFPTPKTIYGNNSYYIIYEEYESIQHVQTTYDVNGDLIQAYCQDDSLISHTTLLGDSDFKRFLCQFAVETNKDYSSNDYIDVSVKDIFSDSYKKRKAFRQYNGNVFIRHIYCTYLESQTNYDKDSVNLIKSAVYKCEHRVYMGDILIMREILDRCPLVKFGRPIIESMHVPLYSHRGLSYACASSLLLYAAIISKLGGSVNNSINKVLLLRSSLIKKNKHGKSASDMLSNRDNSVILLQDNKTDRPLSADAMPIQSDLVDRSAVESCIYLNQTIKDACGLLDQQKLSESALQDKYRIAIQQVALNSYCSEVEEFLKQVTLLLCSMSDDSIDMIHFKVIVQLDAYSGSYRNRELTKLITASRLTGGAIQMPLADIFELLGLDKKLSESILNTVSKQQEAGSIEAEYQEAEVDRIKADTSLKLASADEKKAKAALERKKAKGPVVKLTDK